MLGRRDVLKRIEAEVQDLETRHAGVVRRLESASTEAEQAITAQRLLLVAEHVDAAAARKAADACRAAIDRRAGLEDAVRTLASELNDARQRRDAERDSRARESVASEIEARAERIQAAAARLDDAAEAFDEARQSLVDTCRQDAQRDLLGGGPEYALVAAAARRAGVLPRDPLNGKSVAGEIGPDACTVAARVAGEMRAKAMAVRQGSGPAPVTKPAETIPTAFVWPEVQVVLSRPARYRRANGHQVGVLKGGATLPEPIAAKAIEMGVGFSPSSVQGQQITAILAVNPNAGLRPDGIGGFRADNATAIIGAKMTKAEPVVQADLGELPDGDGVFAEAAQ